MMEQTAPPAPPAAPLAGFRLSPGQRQLWLQGWRGAVLQGVVSLRGPYEPAAIEAAVRQVVARHEALRTRIQGRPGLRVPLQVVEEGAGDFWERLDPPGTQAEEGEGALEALLASEAGRLRTAGGSGPTCRFVLAERSAVEAWIVVTLPALLADARSLAILLAELADAYRDPRRYAAASGEAVQLLQFSEWRNDVEDEDGAGAAFWREVEERCHPLRLALARTPAASKSSGREEELARPAARGRAKATLRGLAVGAGERTEEPLVAAWVGLLARLTGDAAAVLTEVDGRAFAELEGVIGQLAGPLPLALPIDGGFSFAEVAQRTAVALRAAARRQEHFRPEESRVLAERSLAAIAVDPWPAAVEAGGVAWSLAERRLPDSPWTLALAVAPGRGEARLDLELDYDAALYSPDDAATLLAQYGALLRSGLALPDRPLRDLDLLDDATRRSVLVDFNDTAAPPLPAETVHELFRRAARARPGAPAVVCEEATLTYGELDAASDRLARRLMRLDVGPERRVGLCLRRSIDFIVALLGVLKAGGAYVPLDPALPPRRLAALLAEAEVTVLIADLRQGPFLPELLTAGTVLLDLSSLEEPLEETILEGPPPSASACRPENLAYVLFTSGSTGRPKGVAVEHRQLLNYLLGIGDRLALPADASYAMVSSIAADLGNTAIFPALCRGGCLHVIADERLTDPALFAEYFARHPVDCLKIVPSHLSALLDVPEPRAVLPRVVLVLGGEATSRALAARIAELAPELYLLNHYGPTETTVGVLTCPAEEIRADSRLTSLPLGRPLANSRVYVVDERLLPVPIGVAGELLVAGAGVARGYLGRSDRTAERFLPDPFAAEPGSRLYRTGDIVRMLPGGALRFEGRVDHQVKIRGFRVELGEIEATLRLDPAVRDAAVVVREDEGGRQQLAAYVVPRRDHELDLGWLRGQLRERLPEAMVPGVLVVLDQLPLNANGKVDRGRLPAPAATVGAGGAGGARRHFVGPRTLTEEMLAGLWAEVLGVDRLVGVGVYDSFFELGGHSLLATQLISRVRRAFAVELPLKAFFDRPTVAALAARIEEGRSAGWQTEVPPLLPAPRDGEPLPLSFAQERLWFMSQLEPATAAYNVPRSVRLLGSLDLAAVQRALHEIGRRHEVLRTTFASRDGAARQVVAPSVDLAPRVVDLGALPEGEREPEAARLAVGEARRPFDLERGPLVRVVLLRFADDEHIALLTLHHIVSDAWSMGVLIGELAELYDAFVSGGVPRLPELPIQYADYAAWQRRWLAGEALEGELEHWRKALAGAREEVLVPDFRRPARASFRGETVARTLDHDLAHAVQEVGRREGTTLFMTLVAGFQALLHRETGVEDLVVGTDVANRNRLELEPLIGFFVNNLVLRADLGGSPSFRTLLGRVREATLAAFSHQDLPFDQLVKALRPKRVPGATPLFQLLFVLQNAPRRSLELHGLTLEPFDLGPATSKFDLALFVTQEAAGLTTTWSYRADLFARPTIERLARRYESLLADACRDPERPIAELEIGAAEDSKRGQAEIQAREDARLARLRSIRRGRGTAANV
jgi:amino acid adenylation domain-containing protein